MCALHGEYLRDLCDVLLYIFHVEVELVRFALAMFFDAEACSHRHRHVVGYTHLVQYVVEGHYALVCAQCSGVDLGAHVSDVKFCACRTFLYQVVGVVLVQFDGVVHLQDVFYQELSSRADLQCQTFCAEAHSQVYVFAKVVIAVNT